MVHSQTKKDKERFFADLERLCESDSDADFDKQLVSSQLRQFTKPDTKQLPKAERTNAKTLSHIRHSSCNSLVRHRNTPSLPTASRNPSIEVIDLTSPRLAPNGCNEKVKPHDTSSIINIRQKQQATTTHPRKRLKKCQSGVNLVPEEQQIFKNLVFFFVPNDDVAKPRKIRILRAREYGAKWAKEFNSAVTHVIVESYINFDEATKAFPNRVIPADTILVRSTWLSESLATIYLRDTFQSRFRVIGDTSRLEKARSSPPRISDTRASPQRGIANETEVLTSEPVPESLARESTPNAATEFEKIIIQVRKSPSLPLDQLSGQHYSFSSAVAESSFDSTSTFGNLSRDDRQLKENAGFQCMQPHDGKDEGNPNARTTEVLQEMATYYDRVGDHWRTTSYRKAISALRKQKTLVATREQALAMPQIGTRLADKVEEIVMTNRLHRLETIKDDPHTKVLQLFMGMYGVGHKQALQWIAQGHRTLDDLSARAELSQNQRVGISHYDDFMERIPRTEVHQHASFVRHACQAVDQDLEVIVGGSYRRGNPDPGDIDLLITKEDASLSQIRTLLTAHVIPALTKAGFLKCALASSQSATGNGSKWHGASCLPNSTTWRRIDLLYVPADELGAALLYFTGNDIFNRSMRLLASRKGMRLNQHGLYKDVMRGPGRVKVTDGSLVEGKDEKRIFAILGVPWREPWERKC